MRRKAVLATMIVLPILLLAAGCTSAPPKTSASPTPTARPTSRPTRLPRRRRSAPLRGTTVPAGSLAHPSLAAKIDNHEEARPQYGLDRTDIVFEELVEGGLTRYVAVWHSDIPDEIGPVRSIRPMDPDIITPFGGHRRLLRRPGDLRRHDDGHPGEEPRLRLRHIGLFYRNDDHDAPHNVILHATDAVAQSADLAAPQQQWAYSTDIATSTAALDGAPTSNIAVVVLLRALPELHLGRDDEGLAAQPGGRSRLRRQRQAVAGDQRDHDAGRHRRHLRRGAEDGSGRLRSRDGLHRRQTVNATWSKADAGSPIRFVDGNGVVVRLAPGNTWIELVPNGSGSVALQ